jgi:hypothetical protein
VKILVCLRYNGPPLIELNDVTISRRAKLSPSGGGLIAGTMIPGRIYSGG